MLYEILFKNGKPTAARKFYPKDNEYHVSIYNSLPQGTLVYEYRVIDADSIKNALKSALKNN